MPPTGNDGQVVEYSSLSPLRSPAVFFRSLLSDSRRARRLALDIFRRDFSARYRESFLGVIWAFVPPIVFAISFTLAGKASILNLSSVGVPYPAYVIISICLWQVFAESFNGPHVAFNQSRSVITKVAFPLESIFLAKACDVLTNFGFKLVLIFGVLIWYKIPLSPMILLLPFAVLTMMLMGFSLGLLLIPVVVLFNDIARFVTLGIGYVMFLSPVIYAIPEHGLLRTLVLLNPVTPVLVTARELIFNFPLTFLPQYAWITLAAFVLLFLGLMLNRLSLPVLIERMGA